jgi:lipopolysaccharide biosynthesis regulator YciM
MRDQAMNFALRAAAKGHIQDLDGALRDIDAALELDPACIRALKTQGALTARKGNFEEVRCSCPIATVCS